MSKYIYIIITILFSISCHAQINSEVPYPTSNIDSCGVIYLKQLIKLSDNFFGIDFMKKMELSKDKVVLIIKVGPTLKSDSFSIDIFSKNDTLFTRNELTGLKEYIRANGKFEYCFMLDGDFTWKYDDEVFRKKRYGERISWTFPLPGSYNYLFIERPKISPELEKILEQ